MGVADEIRERINTTNGFKEVVSLRERVWSLSGVLGMRDFLELRDKVERKMREFDDPIFDELKVVVKCRDGPDQIIESHEVRNVLGKGMKLSAYVFTKCPDVLDFELHYSGFDDREEKINVMAEEFSSTSATTSFETKVDTMKEKIKRILSLALRLIVTLFNTYSKAFPNIAEDLKVIREKIEALIQHVSAPYY